MRRRPIIVSDYLVHPESPVPTKATSDTKAAMEVKTMTMDPRGDLVLIVGEGKDKRNFRVCSRTLARSSKVFDVMLYGSFKEAKSNQVEGSKWEIELPEDSPAGFEIILSVIHGTEKNPHMAAPPCYDPIFDVLTLVDKYDMANTLNLPWQEWYNSARLGGNDNLEGLTQHLWITRELGIRDEFFTVLKHLASEVLITPTVPYDKATFYMTEIHGGEPGMLTLRSMGIDELIKGTRRALLGEASQVVSRMFSSFDKGTVKCDLASTSSRTQVAHEACICAFFGAFYRGLSKNGIPVWKMPILPNNWRGSATSFVAQINDARRQAIESQGRNVPTSQHKCIPIPEINILHLRQGLDLTKLSGMENLTEELFEKRASRYDCFW